MKKLLSIIFFLLLTVSPFLSSVALADTSLDPCEGITQTNFDKPCLIGKGDAGKPIQNVIITILVISAVVALVFLVWGGFKWITSGGDKTKVEAARNTIIAAVVGLIVAFLAYFILAVVLGIFGIKFENLSIPNITVTGGLSNLDQQKIK